MTLEKTLQNWWNNKCLVPKTQYSNPRFMDGNDFIQLQDIEGKLINRFKVSELKYLKVYYDSEVITERVITETLKVTWVITINA